MHCLLLRSACCSDLLFPVAVVGANGFPVVFDQPPTAWTDNVHFRGQLECQASGCPSRRQLCISLSDFARPAVIDGVEYIWLRTVWGRQTTSSSSSSAGSAVVYARDSCSCAWAEDGGFHLEDVAYGLVRRLHAAAALHGRWVRTLGFAGAVSNLMSEVFA